MAKYLHITPQKAIDKNTGREIVRAIGPDGNFIEIIDRYATRLHSYAHETIRRYKRVPLRLVDYLYEAGVVDIATKNDQIHAAIFGYVSMLEFGSFTPNEMAQNYAKKVGIKFGLSPNSSAPVNAALKIFLMVCEDAGRRVREQGKALGLPAGFSIDAEVAFRVAEKVESFSSYQRRKFLQNTLFGGVIRTLVGPGFPQKSGLKIISRKGASHRKTRKDDFRDFPLEHFNELISCLNTYRDRAYFLLHGGGGLRGSEIQNLKIWHIDPENQKLWVEDPNRLRGQAEMSPTEAIRFKGRTTAQVFVFEPARQLLFENLKLYLLHEYIPNAGHDYLFQVLKNKHAGKPLKNASDRGLLKVMKTALKKIKKKTNDTILELDYAPHSLRHMYGVYLYNYIPLENGTFGYRDIYKVQTLMGHGDSESTKKYIREDQVVKENELNAANEIIYNAGITLADLPRLQAARYLEAANNILRKMKK